MRSGAVATVLVQRILFSLSEMVVFDEQKQLTFFAVIKFFCHILDVEIFQIEFLTGEHANSNRPYQQRGNSGLLAYKR